jgi:putative phosphoesterase
MQAMPDLNLCFFLGDVAGDAATIRLLLAQRTPVPLLWAVRGNCDFATTLPEKLTVEAAGRKIFATHGHLYGVGYGLERLLLAADAEKADIVLFGHTHRPYCSFERGMFVLNPGAVAGNRSSFTHSASVLVLEEAGIHTEDVVL